MNQIVELYHYLPAQCRVDKEIPQKSFTQNGRIISNDSNKFDLYFVNATLAYVMRRNTGDLPNLEENDPYGDEIHVMEVTIRTRSDGWHPINNFARAILESYPRPMLLILVYQEEYCIFTSLFHVNSRHNNKNSVDRIQGSGWINKNNRTEFEYPWDYFETDHIEVWPQRSIEKDIYRVMMEGSSIENILQEWKTIIGADRGKWIYFYHASDNYHEALSIIRNGGIDFEDPTDIGEEV